ncbi:hypothetical protein ABIB62_003012 [Mucilaginibacter sp. UYP25]|uniref:hypothetical protein n=1 Tax=unclassified Mucilaginibacter TaxID=2617802 RepID=UPI0033969516
MGLFSFRKNNNDQSFTTTNPISDEVINDIPEKVFIQNEGKTSSISNDNSSNPTDNNINVLFSFLDRNHEGKGYDDALVNPDANHLSQNLEALKNELIRVVNKVKTFYEDFIKEINYHIDSRSRSGMVDTVEELKMKREIALSHMEKVVEIEKDANSDSGDSQGILISYTRGFKNGLAAISHHAILKRKL